MHQGPPAKAKRRMGSAFLGSWLPVSLVLGSLAVRGEDSVDTQAALRELRQQNELLQRTLRDQQGQIEQLNRTVSELKQASRNGGEAADQNVTHQTDAFAGLKLGKVILSGEGGVAMFRTGTRGAFPNSEFRIDEAKLFLDAQITESIFVFTELNLVTREAPDENLHLGELYLDFDNILEGLGWDKALSLRAGRIDIPFGEEYLSRNAVDNPLISHSLSDLWGYDEGVEAHGSLRGVRYALAVQNGGNSLLRDYNADKSVTGRVGYEATPWLNLSASGMRTGKLDSKNDNLSALWFGNGFLKTLGTASTTTFHANLAEGDARVRLGKGYLKVAGGWIGYDDDDPRGNNSRDVYYHYVEAMQPLPARFYAVARFSQVFAPGGFPVVGSAVAGPYFKPVLTPDLLTTDMFRISLGVGYKLTQKLALKTEYALDRGHKVDGTKRDHEDFFAIEAVGGF
ncbi:MAG TPA: hypothetical protein VMF06_22700 [Candidatus Limnocylindria bacterium]|jgi:hypothetical protein|nr:hypothetical protein [Candidatus Limnocylindria bacterium]